MAFWYNLKASGEGDYMTRHAGCPVLTGSKWGTTFIDCHLTNVLETSTYE